MCGIAGFFYQDGQLREEMCQRLRVMTQALAYRGPDGDGHFVSASNRCGLAQRRLAILDLAPTGAQPMRDDAGRFAFTFNGEIYNYRSLREDLLQQGETFRSSGDGEVLFRLLMIKGLAALPLLRGMFALAFWDEEEQSLLLARDRFGIKPLVYAENNDGIAFASEIRGLRAAKFCSGNINPVAFHYYLQWGSIAPPITWISDVQSLLPGHWRTYRIGQPVQQGCFADIRKTYISPQQSPVQLDRPHNEIVRDAVEESVKHHLESDVPVGVFLSGGIDSSSLVSAVRSVSSNRVQTYTITFQEAEFSEAVIAEQVARQFETEHHALQVTASNIQEDLPRILDHLDQPSGDGINSYYVSKAVADVGLKVVLSGTGGDEFFGGYPSFRWLPKLHARSLFLKWLGPLLQVLQKPHRREKWRHLCRHASSWIESYRAVRGLFLPHELPLIAGPRLLDSFSSITEQVQELEQNLLRPLGPERPTATTSRLEVKHYLGVQLLRDIDAMSMAHSLEVRVPLVDHVLSETLWPRLGYFPGLLTNKKLLYESLRRPLPPAVFNRPKQGFTFPFARWIKHDLKDFVREGHRYLADGGWISRQIPEQLQTGFAAGLVHWSRLWSLAIFGQMAMRGPK